MYILRLARLLQWKHPVIVLSALTLLLAAQVPSETPETLHTEQELREYFEFQRRKLDDSELARLHLPSRVIEATAEHPAVIFTSSNGNTGSQVCDTFPVVLTSSGEGRWITESQSNAWYWEEVWTSADRSQIWATLLFHCESANGMVVLLHSSDGGWSWHTLSAIGYGEHYMDRYGGFRLAPDGAAEITGTWSRDGWGPPCPADPEATIDGSHRACEGILINKSNDGGQTWTFSKAVHGTAYPFQSRDDSSVHRLVEDQYSNLEELADRFQLSSMPIDEGRLSGATSLAFDRVLLERATVTTRRGRVFLEIPDEAPSQTIYPYVLDAGSRDTRDGQLIRLPFPGYRWVATCGVVGLLQPAEGITGETWIVQRSKPAMTWTLGKLPALPRAPYVFDSIVGVDSGDLELHVRRLPAEGISDALGRDIYLSADEGRTWTYARFEADVLAPVAPPEIPRLTNTESAAQQKLPRVITNEEADQLLAAYMVRAVADLVENNTQLPAPR